MSDATGIGDARLTVLLDLRSPASYLALGPAVALGEELDLAIDWLPISVPPLRAPSERAADDDRGVLHRRHRARAIAREIETYARARGLVMREIYRDTDARAFELGWLWLRAQGGERLIPYLDAGFRAWWSLAFDPSDRIATTALLEASAAQRDGFEAWCEDDGPRLAAEISESLRTRGLSGAPGYLIGGEFFQGRQHLPMIRWILEGRRGRGPI